MQVDKPPAVKKDKLSFLLKKKHILQQRCEYFFAKYFQSIVSLILFKIKLYNYVIVAKYIIIVIIKNGIIILFITQI